MTRASCLIQRCCNAATRRLDAVRRCSVTSKTRLICDLRDELPLMPSPSTDSDAGTDLRILSRTASSETTVTVQSSMFADSTAPRQSMENGGASEHGNDDGFHDDKANELDHELAASALSDLKNLFAKHQFASAKASMLNALSILEALPVRRRLDQARQCCDNALCS